MAEPLFNRLCLVGIGLIGSSIARVAQKRGDIAKTLVVTTRRAETLERVRKLGLADVVEADAARANTRRYLAPGGTFRLVVPDLAQLARDYLANASTQAAHEFMDAAYLGQRQRSRGLRGALASWLGNSRHQWMWDEKSMRERLEKAGFTRIRRCDFGDATDRRFDAVEDASRFAGCLAMECSK